MKKKYYKRWHEHCETKAPDDKPHYKPGIANLKASWVRSPEDLKKLLNKK